MFESRDAYINTAIEILNTTKPGYFSTFTLIYIQGAVRAAKDTDVHIM